MTDRRIIAAPQSVWTVALVGLATLFAVIAVRYASLQSVWTDEATQLSGLSLGFVDQLRWLAGRMPHAFTVPIDRMPPLSYWLGSLWTHVFGNDVRTIRYLSVCLSVASVFALWAVARLYLEHRMALICAALLALSPNFMVEAAEIRAYASFVLFSTLLLYGYLRLLAARPTPSRLDLWTFALAATLCSYTHFFGIVISAGAFLGLLATYLPMDSRTDRGRLVRQAAWPLLFYLTSLVALIPFIIAAITHSGGHEGGAATIAPSMGERLHDLVKLVYRLFAHQSMLGIRGLSATALLAGVMLMMFATFPGAHPRCRPLLLFLFVNFFLVAIAGLTTSAFSAFSPTYNIWMLSVTSLLAATSLTHAKGTIRAAGGVCIGVLLAADCFAAQRLYTAAEIYGHTRSNELKAAVDSAGANNVVILYGDDAPALYFAMIYDYHAALPQYINKGDSVHLIGSPAGSSSRWICDGSAGTLLVATDQELPAETLQFLISHPGVHTPAVSALDDFLEIHKADLAGRWTLVSRNEYLAQSALALAVFKARANGLPGSGSCTANPALQGPIAK